MISKRIRSTEKPVPKNCWSCQIPNNQGKLERLTIIDYVRANTKSEARAEYCKLLVLKRLPVGSLIHLRTVKEVPMPKIIGVDKGSDNSITVTTFMEP